MSRPVAVVVDPDGRVGVVVRLRSRRGELERTLVLLDDCNGDDVADVTAAVRGFLFTVTGPLRSDVVPVITRRAFAELGAIGIAGPVTFESLLGPRPGWMRKGGA